MHMTPCAHHSAAVKVREHITGVLSCHNPGSGDWTQAIWFDSKCLYLLNCLDILTPFFQFSIFIVGSSGD